MVRKIKTREERLRALQRSSANSRSEPGIELQDTTESQFLFMDIEADNQAPAELGFSRPKTWKTTDLGFDEALRRHLAGVKTGSITEDFFREVLNALKYCEQARKELDPDFDWDIYRKAEALCDSLRIQGNFIGEGGLGDDD